jgi:hypothetical protein
MRLYKSQWDESWVSGWGYRALSSPFHIVLCLVAYLIVERERLDQGVSWRQRKQQLILTGLQGALPALKRVREAA